MTGCPFPEYNRFTRCLVIDMFRNPPKLSEDVDKHMKGLSTGKTSRQSLPYMPSMDLSTL